MTVQMIEYSKPIKVSDAEAGTSLHDILIAQLGEINDSTLEVLTLDQPLEYDPSIVTPTLMLIDHDVFISLVVNNDGTGSYVVDGPEDIVHDQGPFYINSESDKNKWHNLGVLDEETNIWTYYGAFVHQEQLDI
jgi:hypothetical protein